MDFCKCVDIGKLNDFGKALKYIIGNDEDIPNHHSLIDVEFGQWFDWNFFECKSYKKGTLHVKFKD